MRIYSAIFCIVCICSINSVVAQNIQPEYTAFESVSSTDMVNLITGDFTLNMPILEVPGPKGGFSASLAYHGGIRYNQDASWVGLGWNINCGAIARTLSYFPDDFEGQVITTNLVNPGVKSWVKSWMQYTTYYNSQKGKLGQTIGIQDFNITWGNYLDTKVNYTRAGVTVNYSERKRDHSPFHSQNAVTLDGEQLAVSIVSTAISILTYGQNEAVKNSTDQILGALRTLKTAYDLYQTSTMLSSLFTNFTSNKGLWETHEKPAKLFSHGAIIYKESETYLNTGISEKAYGTMHLSTSTFPNPDQDVYLQNGGSNIDYGSIYSGTHDYNMYVDDGSEYQWNMNPVSLAFDQYTVMADGVAGRISPYRFDIGSVATSNFGDLGHFKPIQVIPFKSIAVKFLYSSDIGNKYLHHLGDGQDVNITDVELANQFGVNYVLNSPASKKITLNVVDENVYADRTENNSREGYRYISAESSDLSTGKYINYLTNYDIVNAYDNSPFTGFKGGFCDYSDHIYATNESRRQLRADAMLDNSIYYTGGIAGFCITNEMGYTYHFALPIYNTYSKTVTTSGGTTSTVENKNKYAITWLLTGITGPDFVDRGTKGIIDESDWGYWVKFTYTKWNDSYYKRTPISGVINSADGTSNTYTFTTSQIYYLESVQTKTHAALFIKGSRKDGASLLRLNNIIILNISDFNNLRNQYTSARVSSYCNGSLSSDISNALKNKQLKRTAFKYDENYPLCWNAPSSLNASGKLTLKTLETYYKNDTKILPGFSFFYETPNPPYDVNAWDGWGMFSSNANHRVANTAGNEWCLSRVMNPNGSEIQITYERDDYSNVSGYSVPTQPGGDNRVSEIKVNDGTGKLYSTKYNYTDGDISSGSCSIEPDCNRSDLELYDLHQKTQMIDYPVTPVLYGKTTVLSDFDGTNYLSKSVFEFETPQAEMLTVRPKTIYDGRYYHNENHNRYAKLMNYVIEINTDKIGALNKISSFYNNNLLSTEEYQYVNSHNQDGGIYTEGTLMLDRCIWDSETESAIRLFRTTKIHFPNILKSIVYKDQLGTKTITNDNFDFVTGGVTENTITTTTKSNKTLTIPAYKIYNGMGPKYLDINNKNMLIQTAVAYNYVNSGTISEPIWKPFNVEVQTWKNSWIDINDNSLVSNTVWRAFKNFVWKGAIDANGTYNSADFLSTGKYSPTNIVAASNWNDFDVDGENGWQKTSETTLSNTNSLSLEVKDINGNFGSNKTDLTGKYILASASNARYDEIAYSGAEESVNTNAKFGGDVLNVGGTVDATYAHTGTRSLSVPSGSIGFSYTASMLARKYMISVWVKGTSSDWNKAQLYYKRGTIESSVTNRKEFQAGNWFLLTGEVDISAGSTQFFCKANGTNMYFDDFRIQPLGAVMNTYVYDERGNPTAVLNNDNFAVVNTYDDADRLVATKKETQVGITKIAENIYNSTGCLCSPNFSWDPSFALIASSRIGFKNAEDDATCTYNWKFGDGTSSTAKDPVKFYSVPGTSTNGYYVITCEVKDARNFTASETKKIYVPYVRIESPIYGGTIKLGYDNLIVFYCSTPGTYSVEQIFNGSIIASTGITTQGVARNYEVPTYWMITPGGTNICSIRIRAEDNGYATSIVNNVLVEE